MKISELIINSFEKDESKLDGITEIGVNDFKLLFLEILNYLSINSKDKKEIFNKFLALINKYLKRENRDIGFKIRAMIKNLIKIPKEKINEINVRAFIELLIYINENSHRLQEIWNLSINGNTIEKKLARNSFALLGYFSYDFICTYDIYYNYLLRQDTQGFSYLTELKTQFKNFIENNEKIVNSIKIFKDISISSNLKSYVFEQYLYFISKSLYLFYIIQKSRKITKEQAELICFSFHFILKNTTITFIYQTDIQYFEYILKDSQNLNQTDLGNPFNEYIIKNWKMYFNSDNYLQNSYKSDNKYNLIINNLIKIYSNCFKDEGNKEKLKIHNELIKCFIDDKFRMFKKIISKINDFRLFFDTKVKLVSLITEYYDWSFKKKIIPDFDLFYFFVRQMTFFYQSLFSLSNELIFPHIREEKKQQNELLKKNLLKLDFEEKKNEIKKNNLNHLFLILLKGDIDKYFFYDDQKLLLEFLQTTQFILQKLFGVLKQIINQNEYKNNLDKKSIIIDQSASQLSKIFYFFFFIFEKYSVNHQNHNTSTDLGDKLLELYIDSFSNELGLFIAIFKRLVPFIFKLYKLGCKICPAKNCILTKLINNIFKTIKDVKLRETLFCIYFEYFSMKLFETGNPIETFNLSQNNNINYPINDIINNITILKSIFNNLLDCVTDFQYFKNNIFPLIIDNIYLSKNSEYYGNYIYILRCLFKYLKSSIKAFFQNSERQDNFADKKAKIDFYNNINQEIYYILYGIIKYLYNIKQKKPFLSAIILELVLTMPIKIKYLSEFPHLTFQMLVDSLNNGTENFQINLENLENWMSLYIKNPENVAPYVQKSLSEIIELLSSKLYQSSNINNCLSSLKYVSKLGGKGRNFLGKKKIISRTYPTQILALKLKEKNSERIMNFVLDDIIDIERENSQFLGNKALYKKISSISDKTIINNTIEIYKICLSAFFKRKVDYDYIIEVKKNIIKGINFNEEIFNSNNSFKKMNDKNSRIKINTIYRKKEVNLIEKIISGLIFINSYFIFPNNQKEQNTSGNNIMKFISDYFLLILLSKEKNNKNMLLSEIDPIIIIDGIIKFFFNKNFFILRNTNLQLSEYAIIIINNIIDSINNFFDNDNKIIKNLEIVEIIYMKFINCCYTNESQKIDSGLILLKILLEKFDKSINFKYLKYFFKCITNILSNYSNIVKIQFKSGSNILVEIIDKLIDMFVIKDENYYKLNIEYLIDDNNIKKKNLPNEEKEIIINAKNNFIMLYDFIKYSFDSIIEKIDSSNNYTRSFGLYLFKKIIGNFPQLEKIIPILFQIDISKIAIAQFYKYFEEANMPYDIVRIIFLCNNNINLNHIKSDISKKKYILDNFEATKIYKKINIAFNALTKKIGLRENSFTDLLSYSDSLNNIFYYCPTLIEEYILNENNIDICLEVVKTIYINLLTNYFSYCNVCQYFKDKQAYKSKFIYLFMEKILENKNLKMNFKIENNAGKDIIIENEVEEKYIEYIEKYVFNKEIYRNEVNTRDFIIIGLFEILESKLYLSKQFIKLLNNIFNNINLDSISINKKEILRIYKIKATKLIFLQILNLTSSVILKESSSFLCTTFKKDQKLEEDIYRENYDKIYNYIKEINRENILNSNCYINQDIITGLDKNHINSLLIICKCMKLNHTMLTDLTKKLEYFENFQEDKVGNSQIVLFFGFISLFLYIDAREEDLKIIFRQILNRIKETFKFYTKNLFIFTQTKYRKKIIKLFTKYRKIFSQFLLDIPENKNDHKFIFKLIKIIFFDENSSLIGEQFSSDIANKIKNEIIIKENNKTEEQIKNNINKLVYYLKLCKLFFWTGPIYLKKTSFLDIIGDYMKQITINYDKNFEKLQENNDYGKLIKYFIDISKIYIDHYKDKYKYKYILSLFFFISRKNTSMNEKNKIVCFLNYRLILTLNEKIFEKNYKYILNEFIKFDKETQAYFDVLVDYLIIPMTLRYLKIFSFFECFSVSINKDNSLKIDINKNQINKEKNNKIDEEYLLDVLELLTTKLHITIFDAEKKEEMKYKLLLLIIIIYLEYINKKENNINYNDKTKKIYYTIQSILSNSSFADEEQDIGIWRIYLLLGIILFSKQEDIEKNIKIIFILNKNLNEDTNYFENFENELIISNSHSEKFIDYFIQYYNYSGLINILKIIIKYPHSANYLNESSIKKILNYIFFFISSRSTININDKKIFIQFIGFLISYISKKRETENNAEDPNKVKFKNLSEIETMIFKFFFQFYQICFLPRNGKNEQSVKNNNDINDNDINENFELLQRLIIYLRELYNFQMVIPKIDLNSKNIHLLIQLLRIYMLNIKIDKIYDNWKLYFQIYEIENKNILNFSYFNDFAFVFRCLLDEKLLKKLNNKEMPNQTVFIEHKLTMFDKLESIIKDTNKMNQQYMDYDLKDLFTENNKDSEIYDKIYEKVYNYLVSNRLYIDRNAQNINSNGQNNINSMNTNQRASTTNSSNSNLDSQSQNERYPLTVDAWLDTFHINDFKYFIFIRRFIEEFYSTMPQTLANLNELKNIDINKIKFLKERIEARLNSQKENIDLVYSITFSFFKNFYCFILFFLKEYKFQYEYCYKKGYLNYLNNFKEIKDYFPSSQNFFFNLREYDDIKKIKDEQIDCVINDKEKETNNFLKKFINIMLVYPDAILSGFLFFFDCKEILEKYYNVLLELFLYTYFHFQDKYYDSLIEYLLNKIMFNEFFKDKTEIKNIFMLKLLSSKDQLSYSSCVKRLSENIITIFISYLKDYLSKPNTNKKDPNLLKSLRLLLYNSQKLELPNRKCIFELIKSFIGNSLFDTLKWIFTLEDGDNDINIIIYESIPLSIDLLLSHFQEGIPLEMNTNNFSKFKYLYKYSDDENEMEIENHNEIKEKDYKEYDKNNYIKDLVDNCNLITKEKKVEELLDPIRTNILSDNNSFYKIFSVVFVQIWKMLSMKERETLNVYINEFLYKINTVPKERNSQTINLLFETFAQCSPLIYIKPIIIQSLIPSQNFSVTNIFYLENLLISGIDVPTSLNALINIFNNLQENELSNGLKYFFSKNNSSKDALRKLNENNYVEAENLFYECFDKFKNDILDKINVDIIDNDKDLFLNENCEIFNDLSSWESGLIECYQNNEKWDNIIELSNISNNNDLKLKALWYSGNQNWDNLEVFSKNIFQYARPEETHFQNPCFPQIVEIYSNFSKLIKEFLEKRQIDARYQTVCINLIKKIFTDFSSFHPKNLESIDYYFYFIFQLLIEGWEGTNYIIEILKKLKDSNSINHKENLLIWRERLPHFCEGFLSLKAILEPRNHLFNCMRKDIRIDERHITNFVDKVWNDMTYIKYARKLNLTETFYEKIKLFEQENRNKIGIYPYEIYCKDIEYIKFIRNNIYNYDLGIKLCDEYINDFNFLLQYETREFASYAINNFKEYKAYFYYKKGNILQAHNLFKESSIYKNKESTNYRLYYDWAEMCEEIAILTKDEEFNSEWFENTIYNFLYTIIYKLDKSKFIIPRMITFIKEFKNESLKERFNEEIEEIPTWIWIFWLPILFENFNYYQRDNKKNDFFFTILKKVAIKYKQIIYYPFTIYEKIINNKFGNASENPLAEKYQKLKNIIYSENKYDHCIDKISLIIGELTKKEKENQENSLNSILDVCEMITLNNQNFSDVKNFFEKFRKILKNFPDLVQFKNNFEQLMNNPQITRNKLRECVIKNKFYNHNLVATENKFRKFTKLCEENIYNIDFNNIELPGYFSNKIEEPTEQNKIYISKFESEYSPKFINDARSKVFIKCSNDKVLNFIIVNQDADKNIDMKINIMKIIFNFIFSKNYRTYKRKICFISPIKYHISYEIKIVEEDISDKYNMDEIYEYCLQKRGYSPKIANQIFEEEAIKLNVNTDLVYYSSDNNERLFYKMCEILPQDSLKNFIHKFILTSEEIFIFRNQFTISYSINSLLSFIFLENIIPKNISFNKETGYCIFNTDLALFTDNEYKEIIEQKDGVPIRLTKNISFFLSISSIYGIIPGIFYFSCDALLNKPKILKSILKICLDKDNNDKNIDILVKNYINKFKFILNINDENIQNKEINIIIDNNVNEYNNNINQNNIQNDDNQKSTKIIYDLIDNSMNNDKLKKKPIDYEAWF